MCACVCVCVRVCAQCAHLLTLPIPSESDNTLASVAAALLAPSSQFVRVSTITNVLVITLLRWCAGEGQL